MHLDAEITPGPEPGAGRRRVVALEWRLRDCRNVTSLGVRPHLDDYDAEARALIRGADRIYYPGSLYADLFAAMGKPTFPSCHSYRFAQDKIRQSALFSLLGLPHPPTRVFYGRRQKEKILDRFAFPFVAKIPRGSARGRGVFLIEDADQLAAYCARPHPAYIQQYLPVDRDMRIVVIGGQVVHAYWRLAAPGDFRSNVSVGGRVCLDPVPPEARSLATAVARRCGWDDVGIDLCRWRGDLYVIEANMKYGREGFGQAGLDYFRMMERMIDDGRI